ncbi:VPS10 domain-containing receptor SorCS2 [Perognathus longimembris pacificus]|uniref:VPS10 domain-containing receptor SorCS2 n=1 Tax=Perognathus longimembris pacificus TaxID=214514 RepID=UPI002018AE3F|nr:VPS10 domain-containing receptor SorCS2 [Perognathus longimembris pacificus]
MKSDVQENAAQSEVILILTKYYHADMGKVLESSLWRSSDFGTSYSKLTLQPGVATVIDNFYICPSNKRKIILVSSSLSAREQSLFLSTDEGASFQRQPIPFLVETLLFHPKQEDKVLAYTKEGKLYVSADLGKQWALLQERVTKDRVFWAVSGVDSDPDLVHMEAQDPSGGVRYIACSIHNCSWGALAAPPAGPLDPGSLTVQDEYIFFKATATNRTNYYVSYRRGPFVLMKLPKYALPKDLQIISTDENQVFVAVQEWNQADTTTCTSRTRAACTTPWCWSAVRSSRQAEESVVIDVLEVRGVKGVFLANQKVDGKVTTLITYNKGRDWDYLRPPSADMNGKPTNCQPPECRLHLHLRWADNPYVSGTVHTKDTAPGLIMGAGNLGSQLVEYKEEMYITSDCGRTWRQVFEEEHHVLYLDHGGVIAAIKDTSIPLKILKFSVDEGLTWSTHNFTSTSVFVDGLPERAGGRDAGHDGLRPHQLPLRLGAGQGGLPALLPQALCRRGLQRLEPHQPAVLRGLPGPAVVHTALEAEPPSLPQAQGPPTPGAVYPATLGPSRPAQQVHDGGRGRMVSGHLQILGAAPWEGKKDPPLPVTEFQCSKAKIGTSEKMALPGTSNSRR